MLVNVADPNGELLALPTATPDPDGSFRFTADLPARVDLAGLTIYAQALLVPNLRLTNRLDLLLGFDPGC